MSHLWVRHEVRPTERRAPLVPADAARLRASHHRVTVEHSAHRVFPAADYAAVGCDLAAPGSWVGAPDDVYVLGLKELPDRPEALRHRHVFFGHAYKGQPGAAALLARLRAGGGELLDLEHLVDDTGRRLAAFGYWAGYVGAALAVLAVRGDLPAPLRPMSRAELDAAIVGPPGAGPTPRALVTGALGRSGRGARDALAGAGLPVTAWDLAETRTLDTAALLDHDLLVHAVLSTSPGTPFVTEADLDRPGRLRVVSDVTCDVGSDCHLLGVYDRLTSWDVPARALRTRPRPVHVIAIDNLPALLPREASEAFSADLRPHLVDLSSAPWRRAAGRFHTTIEELADAESALGRNRVVHR